MHIIKHTTINIIYYFWYGLFARLYHCTQQIGSLSGNVKGPTLSFVSKNRYRKMSECVCYGISTLFFLSRITRDRISVRIGNTIFPCFSTIVPMPTTIYQPTTWKTILWLLSWIHRRSLFRTAITGNNVAYVGQFIEKYIRLAYHDESTLPHIISLVSNTPAFFQKFRFPLVKRT